MTGQAFLAVVLAVLMIRSLRSPRVRRNLIVALAVAGSLAAVAGYGAVVLSAVVVVGGGTFGVVALLSHLIIPAAARRTA
jgi:uncharacterized membrane protein